MRLKAGKHDRKPLSLSPGWSCNLRAKENEPIKSVHWRGEVLAYPQRNTQTAYTSLYFHFFFFFYIISWNISFYFKNGTLSAYAKLFFSIMFQEMITQLRGCSLALQYTCPGQPQLSHHLSKPQDLWQDKERRHQNTLALSPSCSLLCNYPPLLFPALFPEQ